MAPPRRFRLAVLWVLVACSAVVIGARLYELQILRGDEYRARAEDQHLDRISVQARRGAILDREGRELAVSLETHSLYAHPGRVEDPAEAARLLAPVIDVPRQELQRQLERDRSHVYLRRFLDPEVVEAVRELDLPLGQAFGLKPEPGRFYPQKELGVHLVGFANIDGVGVEGIEKEFDEALRGDPTVYLVRQDAHQDGIRKLIRAPKKKPLDVVLTIDLMLQHIVERELERAMRETGAKAASGILIDPRTGEVLALGNRPTVDPNHYGKGSDEARRNRAVVNNYEPGSTFKFVPMAAVLENGKARPDERIFCENGLWVTAGRRFNDVSRNGTLTASQVLERSSNIGMVKLARRLSPSEMDGVIRAFGFGERTGVELPGEVRGSVKDARSWRQFTHDSYAFGQEIGVTVLQMAQALATVANDGVRVPPRVVLGVRDEEGRLHRPRPPQPTRVISSKTARDLVAMMESVVERGTGKRARAEEYRVAGKSGTAQKIVGRTYSDTEYFASFGGFGPVEEPRLAGLVVLDSPAGDRHQGGKVAAPVLGKILRDALLHTRTPPDRGSPLEPDPAASSSPTPPTRLPEPIDAAAADPVRVPDVRGLSLRAAAQTLAAHGLKTRVRGSGFVSDQQPAPGSTVASGETCLVSLEPIERRAPDAASTAGRSSS